MTESIRRDLGERTTEFAINIRVFLKQLPRTISSIEDMKQLARSSGSVAANYIEANEAFSNKERQYRMKICRKESKESMLWLRLLNNNLESNLETTRKKLQQEAYELLLIFNAIIQKNYS